MAARRALVRANGRAFAVPQRAPVVGVLIDGNEEAYVDAALAAGRMPHWQRIRDRQSGPQRSTYGLVRCVMPTFTNPNNVAVVTGTSPAVNGICGNFFINEEGEEVMMNDPAFLRCGTIFEALSEAGTPIYVATAKDKLLKLLTHGLDAHPAPSFGFSAEFADREAESAALSAAFPAAPGSSSVPTL